MRRIISPANGQSRIQSQMKDSPLHHTMIRSPVPTVSTLLGLDRLDQSIAAKQCARRGFINRSSSRSAEQYKTNTTTRRACRRRRPFVLQLRHAPFLSSAKAGVLRVSDLLMLSSNRFFLWGHFAFEL